jgi:hypothetical protein
MTSLEHMEAAIEDARLAYVSLKAAHDAPNELCVRVCLEAAETHLAEVTQHLGAVRGNRKAPQ